MKWQGFSELKAVGRLKELAGGPYDLTAAGSLSRQRISDYVVSSCGYDLLYATQRLDERVLDALQDLADESGLIEKFMAMKTGAVINRIEGHESENRQVLHTACRDIFAGTPLEPAATAQAKQQLARLKSFLDDLDSGRIVNHRGETFTTMVQVGIGGSDLGPRALYLGLKKYRQSERSARFIANVEPDDAAEVLADI
ncbi:MAG: glucose-6-phosphate isomerase, partial [Desulfobulbaceae bacterium]|nr:glucose-6-phosphate isomerase [Desulfobulbaceae bacterium]